jgi:hypothetical protein
MAPLKKLRMNCWPMYLKCIYVINSYRYAIVKMPKVLYNIYITGVTNSNWMGLFLVAIKKNSYTGYEVTRKHTILTSVAKAPDYLSERKRLQSKTGHLTL